MNAAKTPVLQAAAGLLALAAGADFALAQTYPNRPIRMVVNEPGGSTDFVARLIVPAISTSLGQQIIVENRGGTGIAQIVSKAPPDGYSLLLQGSTIWLLPFLQDNTPYDPVRDFAPITQATSAPNVLVVHPSVPARSVKELIALAKAKPGTLNFSSSPAGGTSHLGGELFKAMAGINMVWVPYKGAAPALVALVSGEVQVMFGNPLAVSPHLKADRLRALAVTTPEPSALVPGLPTVAASGLPGYESRAMQGIWAPAKTPDAIVRRLNREIVTALNLPDVKQKLFASGAEPAAGSPEEFAAVIKADMARMGKVIKSAGIRAD